MICIAYTGPNGDFAPNVPYISLMDLKPMMKL